MNSVIWLNDDSLRLATEEVMFKFQDLEITRNTLVIRFFDEKMAIPLKEIASYHLEWHLHDPTFANAGFSY